MEIIDTHKSILENLYFLSGPIIAFLGLFIFLQIKLAKNHFLLAKQQLEESQKQLLINSKRQAANLAADKVKEFISEVLPLINKIDKEKRDIQYPEFKGQIKNFANVEIKDWDKTFRDFFLENRNEIMFHELDLLNSLEALSLYFTEGIADEKIAFISIGSDYCRFTRSCYPTICLLRGGKFLNVNFNSLISLYKCWSERLENYNIANEKEELSKEVQLKIEQLAKLKNKKSDFDNIKIIGT